MAATRRLTQDVGAGNSPARSCIVTRAVRSPEEMVRFVLGPDGEVVPDVARKLPGRGVWVTCHHEAVRAAAASQAFARAFRRKVGVGQDLAEQVDRLLLKRALELLSLCNKAGLLACGSGKVGAWIEAGANGALLQAADASPDGLAKVARKYRAVCAAAGRQPVEVSLLTIEELSLAIGRANVVHAALNQSRAASNFLAAASRLARYRADGFETSATVASDQAAFSQQDANRNTGQV